MAKLANLVGFLLLGIQLNRAAFNLALVLEAIPLHQVGVQLRSVLGHLVLAGLFKDTRVTYNQEVTYLLLLLVQQLLELTDVSCWLRVLTSDLASKELILLPKDSSWLLRLSKRE